ncbi:MAG TPA: SRPBCC family protein [Candidatus Eisenbacteria bacterium]|nr:SRPBCC family protein [Candidatus Eisenbacteria bacterium]
MKQETVRHISVFIDRTATAVYDYASNPENLSTWATGLGEPRIIGAEVVADSPMGRIKIRITPRNDFGILDHDVITEAGEVFHNPMRVVPRGSGSEVVFTLFRQPGTPDEKFLADATWVEKDLNKLKEILESK